MPSGHSGGGHSSGGHFSGGSFSRSSSGHFGGSSHSSSGHFGSSHGSFSSGVRPYRPHRPWYGPRVVVFGGRQVYLSSGRASTVSILGVLIAIAIIVSVFLGISWGNIEETLSVQRDEYSYFRRIAQDADGNSAYQIVGTVTSIKEYKLSDRWCINYEFTLSNGLKNDGYSYFVYSYEEAKQMLDNVTVILASDTKNTMINDVTETVPLDYKDMEFEADEEYVANLDSRNSMRTGTFIMAGVAVLLVLAYVVTNATAKKATAEQIAENNNATTNTQTASTPAGTWRCEYCNAINDNSKDRCDGCGAQRQK